MTKSMTVTVTPSAEDIKSLADRATEMSNHLQAAVKLANEIASSEIAIEINPSQQSD